MAIPAGLHLQPLSPCSTCSVSDETSAMPSNAMDDEASEATARDLVVDQLACASLSTWQVGSSPSGPPTTRGGSRIGASARIAVGAQTASRCLFGLDGLGLARSCIVMQCLVI